MVRRFFRRTLDMQRCLRHVVAAFHRIKHVYHKCKKRARLSSPASFSASPLHTSVRELNVRRRAARSAGGPRERNSRPGLRIISRLSTVGVCTSDVLVEHGASSLPRLPERHAGTVHARLGLEVDHARLHQAWQHHSTEDLTAVCHAARECNAVPASKAGAPTCLKRCSCGSEGRPPAQAAALASHITIMQQERR